MTWQWNERTTAALYEVRDYSVITAGLLLYTFAFTVFILPYEIVTGGIAGVGAIVFYATRFPVQYTFFIINAVLIVVALRILGWRFLMKTIYATVVLTLMLEVAQGLVMQADGTPYKLLGEGNDFMSLLIGCCMSGTALAIVFLSNGSTGGTDIIAAVANKYSRLSIGRALIIVDFLIVGSSLFIDSFGTIDLRCRKVVFGLCTILIECSMLDFVMNRRKQSVQFLIISRKYRRIADAVGMGLGRGITILDGHGWYTGNDVKVLCIITRRSESVQVLRLVKTIDRHAFVSQGSVIGTYGEGFDRIKVSGGSVTGGLRGGRTRRKAMTMVFATNNAHKIEEMRDILGVGVVLLSPADIGCHDDIPETADTLEGNALMKARYVSEHYGVDCFADDTGLEVDALGGAPGVRSARYAGDGHDSQANRSKLLREMEGIDDRRARFRTVIALVRRHGESTVERTFCGEIEGTIARQERGDGGFGYDSLFIPEGYDRTFAELGDETKNKISHRARAAARLAQYLYTE